MRKYFTILFCIIILACAKDDSTENEIITIDGGQIKTYELVTIESDETFNQEQYEGFIGETNIPLFKSSENMLVFKVPANITLGTQMLTITNVPNIKINYSIIKTELNGSAEDNLSVYFSNIDNYAVENSNSTNIDIITQFNAELTEFFNNASEEDKISMALIYQANKEFFDYSTTSDFSSRMNSNASELLLKFSIATVTSGVSAAAAYFLPTAIEKLLFSGVALYAWNKAVDYHLEFRAEEISIVEIVINSILGENSRQFLNDDKITFLTDEEISFPFEIGKRITTQEDQNSINENFNNFFSKFDLLNTITFRLNDVIQFINDNVFFSNIPLLNVDEILPIADVNTGSGTNNEFNNLTLSIGSTNNLQIDNVNYSNGNISFKIKIINESQAIDGTQEGRLEYDYVDDFNSLSGFFEIAVCLNTVAGTNWNGDDNTGGGLSFGTDGTMNLGEPEPGSSVTENSYTEEDSIITANYTIRYNDSSCGIYDIITSLNLTRISPSELTGTSNVIFNYLDNGCTDSNTTTNVNYIKS